VTWRELFQRGADHDVTEGDVRDALARLREPGVEDE